jgi:hypothetical protein
MGTVVENSKPVCGYAAMSLKKEIRSLSYDELEKLLHSAALGTAGRDLALREYHRRRFRRRMKRKLTSVMHGLLKYTASLLSRRRRRTHRR